MKSDSAPDPPRSTSGVTLDPATAADLAAQFQRASAAAAQAPLVVDLHRVKATNPVAEVFAAPFMLAGVGLFALFHGDRDNEDPPFPSESQSKSDHEGLSGTLLGLGFVGIGAGVYALFGGDSESLSDYPRWVDFNAPPDAGEPQTPPGRREEDRGREERQSQRRL